MYLASLFSQGSWSYKCLSINKLPTAFHLENITLQYLAWLLEVLEKSSILVISILVRAMRTVPKFYHFNFEAPNAKKLDPLC